MSEEVQAVFGATRGTGLEIIRCLAAKGVPAVALARDPHRAQEIIGDSARIVQGDVTRPATLEKAIQPEWRAIHFTVDITGGIGGRGMFGKREEIYGTVCGGLINTVEAAKQAGFTGQIVLLSTVGLKIGSFSAWMLDTIKRGLLQASIDKGEYLRNSGLDYSIVYAGILNNKPGGSTRLLLEQKEMPMKPSLKIARRDLARVMVAAVGNAKNKEFNAYEGSGTPQNDSEIAAELAALSPFRQ